MRATPGKLIPSFVASDGLFTMFLDPLPQGRHLAGLPEELLELANDASSADGSSPLDPSTVLPQRNDGGPARPEILPGHLVVHRYPEGVAYLQPCLSTLKALEANLEGWIRRESCLKTLPPA